MLPPGHIAGGYLTGKIASQFIPALNTPELLALTAFAGFLPDLDFFLVFIKAKKFVNTDESINHRTFLTHAPLLYLLLFVVCYLIFPEYRVLEFAFVIGTWSHIFIYTFSSDGIQWL
ncbi:MAG: metal-dependent hydrolase [Candidatus Doudnabacteria bacterium]|nr:metal-dependent hydrolase [Candidatus Doudnabacteria bacterium]